MGSSWLLGPGVDHREVAQPGHAQEQLAFPPTVALGVGADNVLVSLGGHAQVVLGVDAKDDRLVNHVVGLNFLLEELDALGELLDDGAWRHMRGHHLELHTLQL